MKLSARKDNNLARVRETSAKEVRSGVDLLSGSPVRGGGGGAGATSKVVRNLAKNAMEEEEQKAADIRIRELELDFQVFCSSWVSQWLVLWGVRVMCVVILPLL